MYNKQRYFTSNQSKKGGGRGVRSRSSVHYKVFLFRKHTQIFLFLEKFPAPNFFSRLTTNNSVMYSYYFKLFNLIEHHT